MIKLFTKIGFYLIIMLFILEALIRVLHLTKDTPNRYLDEHKVEKWMPNQQGYEVTGNRRQNFTEFRINNSGFNSFREFNPTKENIEIAIIGDSFIQGFHQNYDNSIGKKIENALPKVHVYEYGYAGYDFADQIHLMNSYKKDFDLIDHVIFYLDFETDLKRSEYEVIKYRLALQTPLNNILKKCKLLVYIKNIGLLDSPKKCIAKIKAFIKKTPNTTFNKKSLTVNRQKETEYLNNFKKLIERYGFNKNRCSLLLDSEKTPQEFINYLNEHHLKYIDFNTVFKTAVKPTNLIYDQHWNNYGRTLVAKQITEFIQNNKEIWE